MVDLAVHPYGTLKPLEWANGYMCVWCDTMAARYVVEYGTADDGRKWFVCKVGVCVRPCDSIEHGKQLCWEHYQQQVRSLFVQDGGA